MAAEVPGTSVRFTPNELLAILDAQAMSALPMQWIGMALGSLYGTADGVISAAGISWTMRSVGSGGSVAQLERLVLYGGSPDSYGVSGQLGSFLPTGILCHFDASNADQVASAHDGQLEFLSAQTAGVGASVWWGRVVVPSDLGNRRKWVDASNKEKAAALLTRNKELVTFAVVDGDDPFGSAPAAVEGVEAWHRAFFVSFDDDGVPDLTWAIPMDYWVSEGDGNSHALMSRFFASEAGAVPLSVGFTQGTDGFHMPPARAIRWLADQLLRTRDNRAQFTTTAGGLTTYSGNTHDFYGIDRGLIQVDEDLAALEAAAGVGESGLPPLLWVGEFHSASSTQAQKIWSSPSLGESVLTAKRYGDSSSGKHYGVYRESGPAFDVSWGAFRVHAKVPTSIAQIDDTKYKILVLEPSSGEFDSSEQAPVVGRYEHVAHIVFFYGEVAE